MSSLMDSINSRISPELTSSLASRFGIPTGTINSALQTSSATILTALASKAQDNAVLGSIYRLITVPGVAAAAVSGSPDASASTTAGINLLTTLFGTQMPAIETKIAEVANIPVAASTAVLASAAPLVTAALSNRIATAGLSAAALGGALVAELPTLKSYLPAGFAIPGFPVSGIAIPGLSAAPASTRPSAESKASAGWLWPVALLGAVLIACLVWYFNRGKEATTALTDTATQATSAVASTAQNAIGALGAFFNRKLPNGVELNIPENGIENKLIAFIEDASKPVDKETWFDFDRLLFATGSSTLEPSSTEQLQNIAAILKAYPNVHLRIGGYTDNTGDAQANMKLSQDRAASVLAQLVSLGVEPARLDSRGYGEEHPVADNSTEAGRAQNRRISVRVTQK